jgi:muramoyltetrapeptide carboxypeptidase
MFMAQSSVIFPPYLKKGDTIGMVCPAGLMPLEKTSECVRVLNEEWGFKTIVGKTVGTKYHYFSAPDEERLADLQWMLDEDSVKAILFCRGGYGLGRIIEKLDFRKFRKNPKWIIGFSDITILHAHLYAKFKIASLHAPMANAFNNGEYTNEYVQSLFRSLIGKKARYTSSDHPFNQPGEVNGVLVGGNLSLVVHIIGTSSDLRANRKILFLEDVGEYLYHIDRMFYQLKRCGKLDKLAGLIIGGFTDMKDTENPFGKTVEEIIHDLVKEYKFPVCFGFPVSHSKENYALKVGAKYNFKVSPNKVSLEET